MATPPVKNRPAPADYLAQALRMNPLEQAADVIRLRNRFLGVADASSATRGPDPQDLRGKMARRIEAIREHFWTVDLKRLRRELASLKVDALPDLRMAADRLQAVMEFRSEFPRLAGHPNVELELFNDYKRAVTLTRREAAAIKTAVLDRLRSRDRIKRYQKMVRMMRREFPELYELEEDWLQQILKARPRPSSRREARADAEISSGSEVSSWIGSWVFWLVAIVVLRLLLRVITN